MVASRQVTYSEISPSEFFYRNRDLAGFSNPSRALYTSVRELVENSLDACEQFQILPEIMVKIENSPEGTKAGDQMAYVITIKDNGPGIESKHLPNAFGRVFYGSKYKLKQSRGMFGMGGTMAILYAQITTNKPVTISSSFDGKTIHILDMLIDIQENKPVILRHDTKPANGQTGTTVSLTLMGDYFRAGPKILDYFKQTALVTPYANLTLVDPESNVIAYKRATMTSPAPPTETLPHPHGIDVEALRRLIKETQEQNLVKFMTHNFHRVGERTAEKFLKFAGFDPSGKPKSLSNEDAVKFVNALHQFEEFLSPDASCLSPLGEEIMQAGIMKELQPEFIAMCVRPPSAYSGFPFIVEVGLAYGGAVIAPGIKLMRFANRIPLLYDEANDVAFKVINEEIDWKRYKIPQDAPIAVITHVCSTKVPYKTVGKEYLADRPELERELKNAAREVLRKLAVYVSRKGSMEFAKKKMNIYGKYLPLIARFATDLSGHRKMPDYKKLLGNEEAIEPDVEAEKKQWEEMEKSTSEISSAHDAKVKEQQQQRKEVEAVDDEVVDAIVSDEKASKRKLHYEPRKNEAADEDEDGGARKVTNDSRRKNGVNGQQQRLEEFGKGSKE
ncbi:MAG TPA: DNA topoisomerase VI subunit B [Nitrososphaerales archaeon]|nr:DNA topoisomerase VI subunit B [Nitrososphaerales archaeon]